MANSSKSEKLSLLARLATSKEDSASVFLSQAKEAYDAAQLQLDNLIEYEANYLSGMRHSMSGSSNLYHLNSCQHFIAQLSTAIEQQRKVVEQAELMFQHAKDLWVKEREKRKSIERLRDEAKRFEDAQLEKKIEARILDDYVAAKYGASKR